MKSIQYIFLVAASILSIIIQSCTKKEIVPDLKGSMAGYVYTFDEYSRPFDDHSGVTILAIGHDEVFHTFSDKNGRFEFEDLPAGTYELRFKKEGFGLLRQFGIKHLGGEPTVLYMPFGYNDGQAFFIYKPSTTQITDLKIENGTVYCECSLTIPETEYPDYIELQLYFSLMDNFDYRSAKIVIESQGFGKDVNGYTGYAFYNSLFKSGDIVYLRACVRPYNPSGIILYNSWHITGIDSYFDYETNTKVFPALGKISDQFSFIVP